MTTLRVKLSFGLIAAVAAGSLGTALLGIDRWHWSAPVLILIAVAAFVYQILVLSLLDRIGREEKRANLKEMIKQTYLIAAVATIVSIVGLRCLTRSYVIYGIVTAVCCLISFSAVRKNRTIHTA
jgi:MFS family permease